MPGVLLDTVTAASWVLLLKAMHPCCPVFTFGGPGELAQLEWAPRGYWTLP